MSSVIRSLIVKVGADLSSFDKSLKTVSKNLKTTGKSVTAAGAALTKGLTVPILGAATALTGLTIKAGQNADELITMSNKTGIATQMLQELQYAARFVDVAVETMTDSVYKLIRSMAGADTETKTVTQTVKAFSQKAISVFQETASKQEAALKRTNEAMYESTKSVYDKRQSVLKTSLDKEYSDFEKASDKKIKLIDKEFIEQMKLIDYEEYAKIKAIDSQIDALNGQTDAEERAARLAEEGAERIALQRQISNAQTEEERQEAVAKLATYEKKLELQRAKEMRNTQIESLRQAKDTIKEEYDLRKEQLSSEYEKKKSMALDEMEKQKTYIKEVNEEKLNALETEKETALQNLKEVHDAELNNMRSINQEKLSEMKSATATIEKQVTTVSETAQAFKRLGIETKNADGSLRNSKEVWLETIKALGNVANETERDALAMTLFGRSAQELNPLIVAGTDELKRLGQEAHDVGAVMSDENVTALGKLDDQMQKLQAVVATAGAELGGAFLPLLEKLMPVIQDKIIPAIAGFAEKVGVVVDKFLNLDPGMQNVILSLIGLAVAIGPVMSVIGGLTTTVGGIIGKVGGAIKIISGGGGLISALGALAGPAGIVMLVIAGLAALVLGIKYLWDTNEGFRNAVTTAWEAIKAAAIAVFDWLKPYFIAIWDAMVTAGKALLELFGAAFEAVFNSIKAFWDKWGPAIKVAFQIIWDFLKVYVGNTLDGIKIIFETVFNVLTDIFKIFAAAFRGDWEGVWNGVKNLFADIWNGIVGIAEGSLNGIIRIVNKAIEWLNKIPAVNIKAIGEVDFSGAELEKHAAGGIFTKPTLWGNHLIGEAGPEALIPLDRLAGAGAGGYGYANITMELDGRVIARAIGQPLMDIVRVKTNIR